MAVKRGTFGFSLVCPKFYCRPWQDVFESRIDWNTDETNGFSCSREHFRVSKTLSNPSLLIKSPHRSSQPERLAKHTCTWSLSSVILFCQPKALVFKVPQIFLIFGSNHSSSLLTLYSYFLFQTYFALMLGFVTCCYLSQPWTLV